MRTKQFNVFVQHCTIPTFESTAEKQARAHETECVHYAVRSKDKNLRVEAGVANEGCSQTLLL